MKTVKKVFLLILSLFMLFMAFATAYFLQLSSSQDNLASRILYLVNPYRDIINLNISELEEGLFNSVSAKGITIGDSDNPIATVDSLKLSISLIDLLKISKDDTPGKINAHISGVNIAADFDIYDFLDNFKENTYDSYVFSADSEEKDINRAESFLSEIEFNIQVNDLNAKLTVAGRQINVSDSDVNLIYKDGQISDINASVPKVSLYENSLDSNIEGSGFNIIQTQKGYKVTANEIAFAPYGKIAGAVFSCDSDFTNDSSLAFVNGTFNYEGYVLEVSNAQISSDFSNLSTIQFIFDALSFTMDEESSVYAENSKGVINLKNGFNLESVQLTSGKISVKGLLDDYVSGLSIKDVIASYSNVNDYVLNLDGFVSGIAEHELIDVFSFDLNLKSKFDDFYLNNLVLSADLKNTDIACLVEKFDLSVDYTEEEAGILFENKDIALALDYGLIDSSYQLSLNLYEFDPLNYEIILYKFFPQYRETIQGRPVINAGVKAKGILDSEEFYSDVDLNTSLKDFEIKGTKYNGSVSMKSHINDNSVNFDYLCLDFLDYSVLFKGIFDLTDFFPKGQITVNNINDTLEICCLDVDSYSFSLSSAKYNYGTISGSFNPVFEDRITGEGLFKTLNMVFPYRFVFDMNQRKLTLETESLNMELGLDRDSVISGNLFIDNLEIKPAKNLSFVTSGIYTGKYDLKNRIYSGSIKGFNVDVSNTFNLGFDVDIRNGQIEISDLSIGRNGNNTVYQGFARVFFDSVFDLVYDTKKLDALVDFKRENNSDFFKATLIDESYEAEAAFKAGTDISLKLLGNRDNGCYANCTVGQVKFIAHYYDKNLYLYNGEGNVGTSQIDRFNFEADIPSKSLSGSISIINLLQNHEGNVEQGGTLNIDAKLDSIKFSSETKLGFDIKGALNLEFENVYFGDSYSVKDNSFTITVDGDDFDIGGDLVNGFFNFDSSYFDITVDPELLFGFKAKGYLNDEDLDICLNDLSFPLPVLNQFINWPFLHVLKGQLNGDLLITGPKKDPSFYGMLNSPVVDIDLFWIPYQKLSLKSISISAIDHDFRMAPVSVIGYSSLDGRVYNAVDSLELSINDWKLSDFIMNLSIDESPIDFWLPLKLNDNQLNIRGDVLGNMVFKYIDNDFCLDADLFAENSEISFKFPDFTPQWFWDFKILFSMDMNLTTGKDVTFYYPDKDNYFLSFTTDEDNRLSLKYDSKSDIFTPNGQVTFKSGEIYYIQNTFKINEGSVNLGKNSIINPNGLDYSLDLTASLKELDAKGISNEIFLVLKNATLDNISPKFDSSSALSENEILQLLGQAVVPKTGEGITVSSVASLAAAASDTVRRLGLIQSNSDYSKSITSSIRDSLKLDVFSIRSQIVENIIVQALPGVRNNTSAVSRYLDGTSLFAGKYVFGGIFAKMSALLKSVDAKSKGGQFLTDDLRLDLEFSLDWDNPLGSFSVFIQPQELSVINFLDTIGFSYVKTIKF